MKKVPFYPNHPNGMHCAVAVYRMLFDYFLHRKLGWEEAEKLAGFKDGRAAWTVTIWERMSRMGFDIRMIEPFDYRRYTEKGDAYLRSYMKPEEYDWLTQHSNIRDIQPLIPAFLQAVRVEQRRPTLKDIDDMLADGRLVFLTLNSNLLNDKPGYAQHAVLVFAKDDEGYRIHDPKTDDPRPDRYVPAEKLWAAMGGKDNSAEATGVKLDPKPTRADVQLARMYPLFSRAALAKLFSKGLVKHGDKVLKPGDKVPADAQLDADISSLQQVTAEIDLPVLYEDDDCLVINKPTGVLTHTQGAFNPEPTVATFLRNKVTALTGERAGIVHRLDRPTSGVLVCAKNPEALSWLQQQFSKRLARKTYVAVVQGELAQPEAIINMPIQRNPKAPATFRVGPNGKQATTRYKVLRSNGKHSLLELYPETGRTHQLRVHLAKIGHPIVGDPLYGKGKHGDRLYLHALSLTITLPDGETKTFRAPLPPEFAELVP
jgi:23S rRNA pseudouridine1911/1915/1917 synthase